MQLAHIDLCRLSDSRANMRGGKQPPDIGNLLPSVRARGILQTLLVRPSGVADHFEVVAGRRRYYAALALANEGGTVPPLPCGILDAGDDAAAVEASLIENVARLDPDEVTQWETFTRLIKEGRAVADIAATFGLGELTVKRILALGNLLPRIRELYRREEIDAATVCHLTMATKARQRDWLALYDDPDTYCPTGHRLKAWLLGGASIATSVALFDVEGYAGQIVTDLFGEERYFADADTFWVAQNAAIATRRAEYLDAGWNAVEVIGPAERFHHWEYVKIGKRKGGRVYIEISPRGEVVFHEGYMSRTEAQRIAKGEAPVEVRPTRPERTAAMQTYVDLHRHAAVRAVLTKHSGVALRLMLAHAINGSALWHVRIEPQRAGSIAIAESVASCASEAAFDAKRRAVLAMLKFEADQSSVSGGNGDEQRTAQMFARLLDLSDDAVLAVLAIVMGETLSAGRPIIEAVGMHLGVDMAGVWQADDAFFALLRDRQVLIAMLAEVVGDAVASANANETTKTLKQVIRDHLSGSNGRPKVDNWLPRWLRFPAAAYTERGRSPVEKSACITALAAE